MPDQPTHTSKAASTESEKAAEEVIPTKKTKRKTAPLTTKEKKTPAPTRVRTSAKRSIRKTPLSTELPPADPSAAELPPPEPLDSPKIVVPSPISQSRQYALPLLATAAIALAVIYLVFQFRGLSSPAAMDQAQIARHLAEGKGFSTGYIRPLALWQLESSGKPIPTGPFPDFFHAPLNPHLNSIALKLVQPHWKLSPIDIVYIGDRAIAILGVLTFLGAIAIWYAVACRLFSKTTALLGCAILLATDLLWQFSISGLPQIPALLLFGGSVWFHLKSTDQALSKATQLLLTSASGAFMGLMILAHGATAWLIPGWLFMIALGDGTARRAFAIGTAVAAVSLVVLPWLIRTHMVSGSPFGLAIHELVAPANSAETGYMRDLYNPPSVSFGKLFARFQENLSLHSRTLPASLGTNLAAIAFFISLLHRFDSSAANRHRWPLLLMWTSATLGMILAGADSPLSPSNLHILFLPLFAFYGTAFLRDLFDRLSIPSQRLRRAFPALLVVLCGIPMWNTLLANKPPVQWPPYVPPFIAILGEWYEPDEIIASDMPWAVAWYAQRKSLLLPKTIKDFNRISDYRVLGDAITGLYLTPLTGNSRLFSEIYKGPYTDWVMQITRPPVTLGFPLPVFTPLPIDGECILFSDRDRWSRRE